ncbi:hypothetical protein VP01_7296g1, partial [Puccinia sorghi]
PFLKLKKSLYGLKQAPSNWYDTLTSWFNHINFTQSTADPCLFIHKNKGSFIFFHVDNLIFVGDINNFEDLFLKLFPNSTAHEPNTLLGIELNYESDSVSLSQRKLIDKGLKLAGIKECWPVNTPLRFQKTKNQFQNSYRHPQLLGMLNSAGSRSCCLHTVYSHFDLILTIYLTQSNTIPMQPGPMIVKPQHKIIHSSTKAEMNALSDGVQEIQWIKFLIEELYNKELKPTEFQVENKGLIDKINNFGSNSKTKHLDIKAPKF